MREEPGGILLETALELSPLLPDGGREVPGELLARLMNAAYRAKRKKPAGVGLLVTTDGEIARLNHRHLGKNRATDVLAFEDGEVEAGRLRLGDIAISYDTAKREAAERGVEFAHELAFYALHGLMHLLGMRDGTAAERRRMHEEQAAVMRACGMETGEGLLERQVDQEGT